MKTEPKDCAFQYYRGGTLVEDQEMLTRSEADALWEKHKHSFCLAVKQRENAAVALWIDMKYPGNYVKTAVRFDAEDCEWYEGRAVEITRRWI